MGRSGAKNFKISEIVSKARLEIDRAKDVSPDLKNVVETLMELVIAMSNQLGLDSRNSSKPPSQDPFRKRKVSKGKKRKPGGQKGHEGSSLKPVDKPTRIEDIVIDRKSLPPGTYETKGYEARQVFDISVSLEITEYRAEILRDKKGNEYVADFPVGVTQAVQYASGVKATSVYLSQYQLVPFARTAEFFKDQFKLSISVGSLANFNSNAFKRLEVFEEWAKKKLIESPRLNVDETGINIGGKGHWLHCVSDDLVTLFHADEKRGKEAMERMGILANFKGVLVHDHWKPYFGYDCLHALCNSHHLRELERACEQEEQKWAKRMQKLLLEMKDEVENSGGALPKKLANWFRKRYRKLLAKAEKECPKAESRAQSKSRNLLKRLQDLEVETLRFLEDKVVPFTNNLAERDQRMTKVQQKISGCFRSMTGAKTFCRIRSYLITCRKNGVPPALALQLLFDGKLPAFIT